LETSFSLKFKLKDISIIFYFQKPLIWCHSRPALLLQLFRSSTLSWQWRTSTTLFNATGRSDGTS